MWSLGGIARRRLVVSVTIVAISLVALAVLAVNL
jgi:hypothetical protein